MPEPVLIIDTSLTSLYEDDDGNITILNIKAWDSGIVFFTWIRDDEIIGCVDFCVNAYFNVLTSFGKLFAAPGEPIIFECCDENSGSILTCHHDDEAPEIIMGLLPDIDSTLSAYVVLSRGPLLTVLDEIGHRLANSEHLIGCNNINVERTDVPDPFAGVDMSVCH